MVVSAFGQTGHQADVAERPSVTRTMLQDPTGELIDAVNSRLCYEQSWSLNNATSHTD